MSDDRSERAAVRRRTFLALAGVSGVGAIAGCSSGDDGGDEETDTAAATDAPTTTATTTGASTEEPTAEPTETATPADDVSTDGPLARPPEPSGEAVDRPAGEPGGFDVLDWAGFDGAVSFTFDDGQPSHLEHYDELQATGANVTFYVSANVDASADGVTWADVAADGHEIGNHTVSHPHDDMTGSSFGEPLESNAAEIEGCTEYILEETDQRDVWTMAGPFGESGWAEAARESSLFLNRGVGGGAVGPSDGTDRFDLPCYMAREDETADTFTGLIDSAASDGEWLTLLFHTIDPTDATWYAPVDVSEITASVEHAQKGDLWVDTVASVGAYWLGQRVLESAESSESGGDTVWEWSLPEQFPADQHVRVTVDGGTLSQNGERLDWHDSGYYEVALDEESLTLSP